MVIPKKNTFISSNRDQVCIMSPFPPPSGGIGKWSLVMSEIAEASDKQRVIFFDTNIKGRTHLKKGLKNNITPFLGDFICQFARIIYLFRNKDISTYHSCTSGGLALFRDLFTAVLCKASRKNFILHLHFGRSPSLLSSYSLEGFLFKMAVFLSSAVVALDKNSYNAVKNSFTKKDVRKIPNFINANEIIHRQEKLKQVIFIGNVTREKGVEDLLSAWEYLYKTFPDWNLKIAGKSTAEYLQHLNKNYSNSGVQFIGEVSYPQAIELLQESLIMCLPSHTEGFPFAVLEAMAAGCAIIATNVGAIPEMLENGAGIIVSANNQNELRTMMNDMIENQRLCSQLGAAARKKSLSKYESTVVYKEFRNLWGFSK